MKIGHLHCDSSLLLPRPELPQARPVAVNSPEESTVTICVSLEVHVTLFCNIFGYWRVDVRTKGSELYSRPRIRDNGNIGGSEGLTGGLDGNRHQLLIVRTIVHSNRANHDCEQQKTSEPFHRILPRTNPGNLVDLVN